MIRIASWSLVAALLACHADEVAEPPDTAPDLEAPAEETAAGIRSESVFETGAIDRLQRALRERGYEVEETGELDVATQEALSRFQGERELARTGLPDAETLRQLDLDPDEWIRTTGESAAGAQQEGKRERAAKTKEADGEDAGERADAGAEE